MGVGRAFSDERILGQARHDIRTNRGSIDHLGGVDKREIDSRQGMVVTTIKRKGLMLVESSGFGKNSIERHLNPKKKERKGNKETS